MADKSYSEMTDAELKEAYKKDPQGVAQYFQNVAQKKEKEVKPDDVAGIKKFNEDSEKKNQISMMWAAALGDYGPAKQKQIISSLGTNIAIKNIPGATGAVLQMVQATGLIDRLIKQQSGVDAAEDAAEGKGNQSVAQRQQQEHTPMASLRAAAAGQVNPDTSVITPTVGNERV